MTVSYTYIQDRLQDIERLHNVKILLAVEHSSITWGYSTSMSDNDVMAIFVYNDPFDYIKIAPKQNDDILYEEDNLTIRCWNIKKALMFATKSNPTLVQMLGVSYTQANRQYCLACNYPVLPTSTLSEATLKYSDASKLAHSYLSTAQSYISDYHKANTANKKWKYLMAACWAYSLMLDYHENGLENILLNYRQDFFHDSTATLDERFEKRTNFYTIWRLNHNYESDNSLMNNSCYILEQDLSKMKVEILFKGKHTNTKHAEQDKIDWVNSVLRKYVEYS